MPELSPAAWSLLLGATAALANVAGGVIVVARKHWNELVLKYFIALGAGFMLAATFLKMLPESMERWPQQTPFLVLAGYFIVHFFEHTVAPHFHFGEEVHDEVMLEPSVGISALVGLAIHTFFDGVAIASAFLASTSMGFLIFFAVLLHKIPEGFTVASIALASGRGTRGAITASLVLAGTTLVGVIGMQAFHDALPYAFPLAAGVTLYVAASDLIPEVNEEKGPRMPLMVFIGLALFYATEKILHALGVH